MVDQIPIAHDERNAAGICHGFHGPENIGDSFPVVQCDLTGRLDHGTIHNRVGIRQTDLHRVDTMLDHRLQSGQRIIRIGESIWQIADESRLVLRLQCGKHRPGSAWLMADAQGLA